MQDWLLAGMEGLGANLPGRVVDVSASPAQILSRADAGLCLASGVALAMGSTPIGYVSGPRLASLIAAAFVRLEADAKAARAEAQRMQRDKRMLAAGLTHELRTPVSAISGYSELIALGLQSGRTVSAAHQNAVVWEAAQSLLGTIDSVLDVARIEAGAVELDEQEFALGDLVQTVIRMVATLASARRIKLRSNLPEGLPQLFADQRMIRQILVNLAANAIKYGGDDSVVTISGRIDRRDRMVIEVRDTGPGMSASTIERVMKPFQRGAARDTLPGSGLGLPIVRTLTEVHEGRFQLLSTTGRGTRAIVVMPPGRVRSPVTGHQEAFAFQRASELFG